jgi:hypothetical protein
MEKPGMGRRKRSGRIGLLIFLVLLIQPGLLFSQADGETAQGEEFPPLEIRVETTPANPAANSPWTIYILVNHPVLSEVKVNPPLFPSILVLERVRTEVRVIRGNDSDAPEERWTRVEYLFTPQRAGTIALEPFEVTVPGREAMTGSVRVSFREDPRAVRSYDPRFRWVTPVPPVPAAERGELILELTGWDPSKKVPESIFQGRTPPNAIFEEHGPEASGTGYRYPIVIIPLEGSSIALGSFSFEAEGYNLSVPALTVQVPPGLTVRGERSNDETPQETLAPELLPPYAFPESRENIFPVFRNEYNRIVAGVRVLWDEGRHAEALALIRRNERDSLPGSALAQVRREMEENLGLGLTEDESRRPLRIPLTVWVLFLFLALTAAAVLVIFRRGTPSHQLEAKPSKKNVTSRGRGGFKTVIALIFLTGIVFIFLEENFGIFYMENFLVQRLSTTGKTAVLERTTAYRVPDLKGAVNARFGEGQPVIVGDYMGDWCFAESPDGRSGWVKREAVIVY